MCEVCCVLCGTPTKPAIGEAEEEEAPPPPDVDDNRAEDDKQEERSSNDLKFSVRAMSWWVRALQLVLVLHMHVRDLGRQLM